MQCTAAQRPYTILRIENDADCQDRWLKHPFVNRTYIEALRVYYVDENGHKQTYKTQVRHCRVLHFQYPVDARFPTLICVTNQSAFRHGCGKTSVYGVLKMQDSAMTDLSLIRMEFRKFFIRKQQLLIAMNARTKRTHMYTTDVHNQIQTVADIKIN